MYIKPPIPTDNIHKFSALFGLMLIIFGIGSSVYFHSSTNSLVFEFGVEYSVLNEKTDRNTVDEVRFQLLKRTIENAIDDRDNLNVFMGFLIAIGGILSWNGFRKWHTEIQPLQDELTRLSIEKLKRELNKS